MTVLKKSHIWINNTRGQDVYLTEVRIWAREHLIAVRAVDLTDPTNFAPETVFYRSLSWCYPSWLNPECEFAQGTGPRSTVKLGKSPKEDSKSLVFFFVFVFSCSEVCAGSLAMWCRLRTFLETAEQSREMLRLQCPPSVSVSHFLCLSLNVP